MVRPILYWTFTGFLCALFVAASVPDVLKSDEAVAIFNHLGYPSYLLPFLGTAKLLATVTVLFPGLDRLKEWAYAGMTFDLSGALYSHLSAGDGPDRWAFAVVGLILVASSYSLYRGIEHGIRGVNGTRPERSIR